MNEMSNHKEEEEESVFYMTKPTKWIIGELILYAAATISSCQSCTMHSYCSATVYSHPFSPTFTTTTTKIFFPSHTYFWHKSPRQSENPLCMFYRWPSNRNSFNCSSLLLLSYYLDFSSLFLHNFFSCSLWKWKKDAPADTIAISHWNHVNYLTLTKDNTSARQSARNRIICT